MRISDWSSDVCSSDLIGNGWDHRVQNRWHCRARGRRNRGCRIEKLRLRRRLSVEQGRIDRVGGAHAAIPAEGEGMTVPPVGDAEIGRAACREGVCKYVDSSVGDDSLT